MPDLITSAFAIQALAAGGRTLTTAETTHLGSAISAASRLIQRWCEREFVRATHDEIVDVAWDGSAGLREFPVHGISRVAAERTVALAIRNIDLSTNQAARVAFFGTGDVESGQTVLGLRLTRVASGATTADEILFASATTLSALASAIVALGGGWAATVSTGFGSWPTAELIFQGVGSLGAFGDAELEVWSEDENCYSFDRRTGGVSLVGRAGECVRVIYDAGFATVPFPVQEACAEVVADMLNTLSTDPRLGSETMGSYGYVLNTAFAEYGLTKAVQGKLAPWRAHRL